MDTYTACMLVVRRLPHYIPIPRLGGAPPHKPITGSPTSPKSNSKENGENGPPQPAPKTPQTGPGGKDPIGEHLKAKKAVEKQHEGLTVLSHRPDSKTEEKSNQFFWVAEGGQKSPNGPNFLLFSRGDSKNPVKDKNGKEVRDTRQEGRTDDGPPNKEWNRIKMDREAREADDEVIPSGPTAQQLRAWANDPHEG